MADEELHFKGDDPGAVRHGNFINYYQFHPPEERMKFFPTDIWQTNGTSKRFVCLDIGCNAGNLTQSVFSFISNHLKCSVEATDSSSLIEDVPANNCFFFGIDIDPVLLARAEESNTHKDNITYQCLDFMSDAKDKVISSYLSVHSSQHFDVIFCFSVTMWIHLNHGDAGLQKFLLEVTRSCDMLVIEPQPWKCYRTAVRRLKRSADDCFPKYKSLMWRQSVEEEIEKYLVNDCLFHKIVETPQTEWGRRLLFYKRNC